MKKKCSQCGKDKREEAILPSGICDDCDNDNDIKRKKEEELKNTAKGLKTSSFDGSMSTKGIGGFRR